MILVHDISLPYHHTTTTTMLSEEYIQGEQSIPNLI
jgi:hypothetical protein